jgi:hypothetical protein
MSVGHQVHVELALHSGPARVVQLRRKPERLLHGLRWTHQRGTQQQQEQLQHGAAAQTRHGCHRQQHPHRSSSKRPPALQGQQPETRAPTYTGNGRRTQRANCVESPAGSLAEWSRHPSPCTQTHTHRDTLSHCGWIVLLATSVACSVDMMLILSVFAEETQGMSLLNQFHCDSDVIPE